MSCSNLTPVRTSILMALMLFVMTAAGVQAAVPQYINYQGRLTDASGAPVADGNYLLKFSIYDAATGGAELWTSGFQEVPVEDGLLMYPLGEAVAFTTGLFQTNSPMFLGIKVGVDPEIEPRTSLLSVAYAIRSQKADTAGVGLSVVDDAITSSSIQDGSIQLSDMGQNGATAGQVLKWTGSAWAPAADDAGAGWNWSDSSSHGPDSVLFADSANHADNADNATNATSATFSDSTDAITDGAVDMADIGQAGATSGQVLKWNGSVWAPAADDAGSAPGWTDDGTVVRLVGVDDSVGIGTATPSEKLDVVGNMVLSGKATIGPGHTNTGLHAFVAGKNNTASGDYATVGGGSSDTAGGDYSTVGGGINNSADGNYSTISGGYVNEASFIGSTVGGGQWNGANGDYSTVSGGYVNNATGDSSTISGGKFNAASGINSTISGGAYNRASSAATTVSGGWKNVASNWAATVGGGFADTASGDYSTIGGGYINTASGTYSTVSGGYDNEASGNYSTVSGGIDNTASDNGATVGGGLNNKAINTYSTICGGYNNNTGLGGDFSTICGGIDNTATGSGAMVAGGRNNAATGSYAFAAGYHARAFDDGAFVWGDNSAEYFESTGINQFLIRASGGVGIGTNSPQKQLDVVGHTIIRGIDGFNTSGDQANLYFGDTSNLIGAEAYQGLRFRTSTGNNITFQIGNLTRMRMDGGGICYFGTWGACSDRRFKKDITSIPRALNQISRLQGITHTWRVDEFPTKGFAEGEQLGFIAQDVQKILPSLVSKDGDGYLYVDYAKVTPLLVEAVKEQQEQIASQQEQIDKLTLLVNSLVSAGQTNMTLSNK